MATVFTKIINGELPGNFVWSDDVCVVFASINPITDGHMLVVPRQEISKFTDLSDDVMTHLGLVAKQIGLAQQKAFDAPRAALMIAGFEVPHVHVHVLPAWSDAELSFANSKDQVDCEELVRAAEKIRAALIDNGQAANVPTSVTGPA